CHPVCCFYCFFFFQAEDGIRDDLVTGVQTCALPISQRQCAATFTVQVNNTGTVQVQSGTLSLGGGGTGSGVYTVASGDTLAFAEIGRASCRERVEISVVAGSLKKEMVRSRTCKQLNV